MKVTLPPKRGATVAPPPVPVYLSLGAAKRRQEEAEQARDEQALDEAQAREGVTIAGLAPDQVRKLRRALTPRLNEYVPHTPHVKQAVFLLCNTIREVGFGGATRGGKSDAQLMAALQYVDVPDYASILLRKTRKSLEGADGLIPRSHTWLAKTDAHWNGSQSMWAFPNGATLSFGYCDGPNDVFNYQSTAYQHIGWEELCEIRREFDYEFLFSRQSRPSHGPLSKVPIRTRATFNPVGPGFNWVRERFVYGAKHDPTRAFIPSTVLDNPSVDIADYFEQLSKLPPILRKRLRDGDWADIGSGEVFTRTAFKLIEPDTIPNLSDFHVLLRFWDLAGTEVNDRNQDPDWTRGVLVGLLPSKVLDSRGRPHLDVYILDVRSLRGKPGHVRELVRQTAEEDGRYVYVRIEQEPGQSGKDQVESYGQLLAGYSFKGIRATGDKVVRASPLASQVQLGNVCVVNGQAWTRTLLDEAHDFPYASHDDIVDAMSGAYNEAMKARPLRRTRTRFGPRI